MSKTLRSRVAVVSIAAVAALLAGCSPEERAAYETWCKERPALCAEVKEMLEVEQAPTAEVKATAVSSDQVPAPFKNWATGVTPAAAVFTDDRYTYVGISAGLQSSSGYRVEITRASASGGDYLIEAQLVAPGPGTVVAAVLVNAGGVFQLPKTTGAVTVHLTAGDGAKPQELQVQKLEPQASEFTVQANWVNPMLLQVSGTAAVPDLHFELISGGNILAQADAQVKEGYYVGNLQVEPGARDMALVVTTVESGGGKELARAPVADAPKDGGIVAPDEVWSDNFRVVKPVLLAPTMVLIEGKARAFEGVFQVQIVSGDRVLVTQSVRADEAAPNYGWFSTRILLKGGVPEDAVVKYQLESAKDGSITTELTLPMVRK